MYIYIQYMYMYTYTHIYVYICLYINIYIYIHFGILLLYVSYSLLYICYMFVCFCYIVAMLPSASYPTFNPTSVLQISSPFTLICSGSVVKVAAQPWLWFTEERKNMQLAKLA